MLLWTLIGRGTVRRRWNDCVTNDSPKLLGQPQCPVDPHCRLIPRRVCRGLDLNLRVARQAGKPAILEHRAVGSR